MKPTPTGVPPESSSLLTNVATTKPATVAVASSSTVLPDVIVNTVASSAVAVTGGVAVTVDVEIVSVPVLALVAVTMYCGKLLPAFTNAAPASVKVTSPLVVSMA